MTHFMIDLETLATDNHAAFPACGVQPFTAAGLDTLNFYCKVHPEQNRHIDGNTFLWWLEQSDIARREMASAKDGFKLCGALFALSEFMNVVEPDIKQRVVWSKGSNFDIEILADAYKQVELPCPWDFRNIRDYRTIEMLAKDLGLAEVVSEKNQHTALGDAISQAKNVASWLIQLQTIKNFADNHTPEAGSTFSGG